MVEDSDLRFEIKSLGERRVEDLLGVADELDTIATTAVTQGGKQTLEKLATRLRVFATSRATASQPNGHVVKGGSMEGTDRMLALIARNRDLLRVAAETRARARHAREAAGRAREMAQRAKDVGERAMLSTVRRAILCAAAGGWETTQPSHRVIRGIMLAI